MLANVEWISCLLLTLPVFWCLGGGTTMHKPGAVPETPARGIAALPLDDPLVVSMDSHWHKGLRGATFTTSPGVPPSV